MAWKIEFSEKALNALSKVDNTVKKRIIKFIEERLIILDEPRLIGESLRGGRLGNYWKYRIGDYRLICDIKDKEITILVINIGHRREIYR